MNLGIIGSGSWGTALAQLFSKRFENVFIWSRNKEVIDSINKEHVNKKYFPEVLLNENIEASSNIDYVFNESDIIIVVIPTQFIRPVLSHLKNKKVNKPVISASKGIEIQTLKIVSEVILEILSIDKENVFALSGPSFAKEVIQGLPTAVVLGGDICNGRKLQKLLNVENFRIYTNSDIAGVEIGGAVKNVIAIATGISDGLGLGNNARASLITRGLNEMKRVAIAYNGKPETLYGLSGLGDLVLTATGNLSRNRTFGMLIGKGLSAKQALKEVGQVVEGLDTVKALHEIQKKYHLELPISDTVYKVLYEDLSPVKAVEILMRRELKEEF